MNQRKGFIVIKIILIYAVCFLIHMVACFATGTTFEISWKNELIILVVTLLLVLMETAWRKRKKTK